MDWAHTVDVSMTATVHEELTADPVAGSYADEIAVCPTWGRVTHRARQLLEPGVLVIVDTVIRADACLTSADRGDRSTGELTRSSNLTSFAGRS
ncbi:hypothetical protein ACFXD5_02270 [Streptomyces sp. NPDC059385]|uniref:hypothetical protein n=1 Tax=Streptomyces sp. NPDC059385 TaxID=3346817 RepID=UPI0036AE8E74